MSKFTRSLKNSVVNGAVGTGLVTAAMTPDVGNPFVNLGVGVGVGAITGAVGKFLTYDKDKPETKSIFQEPTKKQHSALGKQFDK